MTAGAIDLGEQPSVVSAIVKYHLTERGRAVINDAMDVHGGKGICLGPSNYLGRAYQQTPIAITVEGANILTRSMIIFGQGAIRGIVVCVDTGVAGQTSEGAPRVRRSFSGTRRSRATRRARSGWVNARRLRGAPGDRNPALLSAVDAPLQRSLSRRVAMLLLGGELESAVSGYRGLATSVPALPRGRALKRSEDDGRPSRTCRARMSVQTRSPHRSLHGRFQTVRERAACCAWSSVPGDAN